MVGYGSSLRRARRPGWEDAYLDYDSLKRILEEMESLYEDDNIDLEYADKRAQVLGHRFLTVLTAEIEKVSLFALSRQGDLADAVGALRFGDTAGTITMPSSLTAPPETKNGHNNNDDALIDAHGMENGNDEDESFDGFEIFGEQAAMLPRTSSSSSLRRSMVDIHNWTVRPVFVGEGNDAFHNKDKLDAYTCLGVELLHLLRYICVNAMGIRKILKKHDKLLATDLKERNLEYVFDWDQFVMKPGSNRLVGGPDDHFQLLANSNSVAAINASLLSALVEYETKQPLSEDVYSTEDGIGYEAVGEEDGPILSFLQVGGVDVSPSLVRFQCAMASIDTLREQARIVNQPFETFLSRKAMIVTGRNLGGLEGSARNALEVLLRFQPDSILTMDEADLEEWQHRISMQRSPAKSRTKSHGGSFDDAVVDLEEDNWGGVNSVSMIINLMSTLLYTINYYIVAPTANHYAILLGTDGAFGATLVGASSFAAIFAAFLYSVWYTRSSFQSALLFSAICPFMGNMLYALAVSYQSMTVAIWGRILVGFGSAEVVNRQLISACVTFHAMTKASALFVAAGALGMSVGPLLAAILDMVSGRDADVVIELPGMPAGGIVFNHVTSPGFVMAGLWSLEILALVFLFSEPDRINGGGVQRSTAMTLSESSSSNVTGFEISSENEVNGVRDVEITMYGSVATATSFSNGSFPKKKVQHISSKRVASKWNAMWSQVTTIKKLIFGNMALPVTLLLFGYIELADEVLISSCSMVCRRYFGWHGSTAGFLIASLGALVLPAHFVVELASRFYEERTIMKHSIVFICACLFAILNYTGLLYDTVGVGVEVVENIESDNVGTSDKVSSTDVGDISAGIASFTNKHNEFAYDWGIGTFVYITFLSAIFMGTIILEGVDTSLMSKVTPPKLNDTFINSGLLATLVGTLGRVCGDSMITISALIDTDVFTDFVNATFFPMIPLALVGYWLVKRYYSLLM